MEKCIKICFGKTLCAYSNKNYTEKTQSRKSTLTKEITGNRNFIVANAYNLTSVHIEI